MKPDASVDYYAALGVKPNAQAEEIKKAFRKQALIYHPDRNRGQEEESKSKFQDVQTAYDCLSSTETRLKYDQERIKKGALWPKRPPAPTRASYTPQTGPFRPGQARPRSPPRAAAGASRYADFTNSSRDSSPFHGSDVNAKFQAFKAFESMKGTYKPAATPSGSPPKSKPAPTAQRNRTRSDWDEGRDAESPRFSRSQSTRTPRKAGFNPYADIGDDTSSRNTSAFYNVSRGERPQASRPQPAGNAFPQPNGKGPAAATSPIYEGFDSGRQSTPYASHSGEKTYFSSAGLGRSASTATNLHDLGNRSTRESQGGSGRFRSASPKARTPQPGANDDDQTSSSGEEAFQTDTRREFYTRRGSADPRASGPKVTVQDESEEPDFIARPQRQKTWDSEAYASNAPPRTHFFPPGSVREDTTQSEDFTNTHRRQRPSLGRDATVPSPNATRFGPSSGRNSVDHGAADKAQKPRLYDYHESLFANFSHSEMKEYIANPVRPAPPSRSHWPYWAIPSQISPQNVQIHSNMDVFPPAVERNCKLSPSKDRNADMTPHNSFSIPSSSSGSASPLKNASTENVDTQFSPTDWHGKFTSAGDYLSHSSGPSNRPAARGRGSPKRPVPRATNPGSANARHTWFGGVPQEAQSTAAADTLPRQQESAIPGAKFSSEEWAQQFQPGKWNPMPPPPPPTGTRPIHKPRSRAANRSIPTASPVNDGSGRKPSITVDDTGDEGDDERHPLGSNVDTDADMSRTASDSAMDIDTNTPPATRVPFNSSQTSTTPSASNATSPIQNTTSFPKPPDPATAFNMQSLGATFPTPGSVSGGLADMKSDLGANLPFTSASSTSVKPTPKAEKLVLPSVPKKPLRPGRLTQNSYMMYMNHMSQYMREYHIFEGLMLQHFQARHVKIESMTKQSSLGADTGGVPLVSGMGGGGFGSHSPEMAMWNWMGTQSDEGYQTYMAWIMEDERVRIHQAVARERHRDAMDILGQVRREVKEMVARGTLS